MGGIEWVLWVTERSRRTAVGQAPVAATWHTLAEEVITGMAAWRAEHPHPLMVDADVLCARLADDCLGLLMREEFVAQLLAEAIESKSNSLWELL